MAIEPESSTERKKLNDTLELLKRQDPTLHITSGETGQTLMRGMGELHLEIVKNRLLRDFNLNVKFHKPQVSYRENDRPRGGSRRRMPPHDRGHPTLREAQAANGAEHVAAPAVIVNVNVRPIRSPASSSRAAVGRIEGLRRRGRSHCGFPLMKLKVTVLGGEWTAEQSDERCLQDRGRGKPSKKAWKKGARCCSSRS